MSKYAIISGFSSTVWRMITLTRWIPSVSFRAFVVNPYLMSKVRNIQNALSKRSRKVKFVIKLAIFTILLLFLCAIGVKWFVVNIWNYKYPYNPVIPSESMRKASDRGLLVSKVTWTPNAVDINGVILQIGESWIEREVERDTVGFSSRHKETGNYHLCFRLERGRELFDISKWPVPAFVLKNNAITISTDYFSPFSFSTIDGLDEIVFYLTINTNSVFHDAIILCLPETILCRPDVPPLAQFQVASDKEK